MRTSIPLPSPLAAALLLPSLLAPAAARGGSPLPALSPDAAVAEAVASRAVAVAAAREPAVDALQRAAARMIDREGGAGDLASRGRWAALLPKVTAEYRHDQSANRVVGLQGSGEVDYLRFAPSDAVLFRASWDLPAVVAGSDELEAAAREEAHAKRRTEAVEKVTKLYFERRKIQVALLVAPPTDAAARAQAEVDIDRLGAEIDALTGGMLTELSP